MSPLAGFATAFGAAALAGTFALFTLESPVLAQGLHSNRTGPGSGNLLQEKKWEDLSNTRVSARGAEVLRIDPAKWRHAETANYILHYRRVTEARKVARELEFYLGFVATLLHTSVEKHPTKSHAFIFEDNEDWQQFAHATGLAEWAGSIAVGDELFLNVRATPGSRKFNSGTLAHEATHAIIARLYPERIWPLWLNEGFAEFVSAAGVAARKNQTTGRHQQPLPYAKLSLAELEAIRDDYPPGEEAIAVFYQSSELFVRFLMSEFPQERFPAFVERILDGSTLTDAVIAVYGDKIPNQESLAKQYAKFKD